MSDDFLYVYTNAHEYIHTQNGHSYAHAHIWMQAHIQTNTHAHTQTQRQGRLLITREQSLTQCILELIASGRDNFFI